MELSTHLKTHRLTFLDRAEQSILLSDQEHLEILKSLHQKSDFISVPERDGQIRTFPRRSIKAINPLSQEERAALIKKTPVYIRDQRLGTILLNKKKEVSIFRFEWVLNAKRPEDEKVLKISYGYYQGTQQSPQDYIEMSKETLRKFPQIGEQFPEVADHLKSVEKLGKVQK